jgi:phage baseplate assembly protein W
MTTPDTTAGNAAYLGQGWSFPPRFVAGGAEVELTAGDAVIAQSISLLLRTQPGERVMRPDVGAGLEAAQFAEIDRELLNSITAQVSDALARHEPRVQLDDVDVLPDASQPGRLDVSVTYTVPANNSRYNLVYPFSVTEADPGAETRGTP